MPFTVGGRSDAAVRRTARFGDGWLASWCSVDRFAAATAMVEELGAERDVEWQHGLQLWLGVGADRDTARVHVAEGMTRFYGIPFEAFEKYTPYGTVDDLVAFLRPYVEAGARVLNLTPCGPTSEAELDAIATLGERLRAG